MDLNASPSVIEWLLGDDNPPVKLLTLTRLLDRSDGDAEVRETRSHLMDYTVTQVILSHSDEFWRSPPYRFWSYKGAHWNTVFLGQFLADGHDPRIAEGIRPLLEKTWPAQKWQCMTACMLTAFQRLGYGDHPTVIREIEALAQRILNDGGLCCSCMNTSLMSHCYMALSKVLLCFSEIPEEQRSSAVKQAIAWIVDEMIKYQVYIYLPGNRKQWDAVRPRSRKKADAPEGETPESWRDKVMAQFIEEHGMGELQPKTTWKRFGFPTNYNSNILEVMLSLVLVKAPMHPAFEGALNIIRDKRQRDGTWLLDRSFNGQMWADVEVKGEASKWITLSALMVLMHFEEQD